MDEEQKEKLCKELCYILPGITVEVIQPIILEAEQYHSGASQDVLLQYCIDRLLPDADIGHGRLEGTNEGQQQMSLDKYKQTKCNRKRKQISVGSLDCSSLTDKGTKEDVNEGQHKKRLDKSKQTKSICKKKQTSVGSLDCSSLTYEGTNPVYLACENDDAALKEVFHISPSSTSCLPDGYTGIQPGTKFVENDVTRTAHYLKKNAMPSSSYTPVHQFTNEDCEVFGKQDIENDTYYVLSIIPDADIGYVKKTLQAMKKQNPKDYLNAVLDHILEQAPSAEDSFSTFFPSMQIRCILEKSDDDDDLDLNVEDDAPYQSYTQTDEVSVIESKDDTRGDESEAGQVEDMPATSEDKSSPIRDSIQCEQYSLTCEKCSLLTGVDSLAQCSDGHLLCKACLERTVKDTLSSSTVVNVKCLVVECDKTVPLREARKVLPALVIDLLQEREEKETWRSIKAMKGMVACPKCSCVMEMGAEDSAFHCFSCLHRCCRFCKEDLNKFSHLSCGLLSQPGGTLSGSDESSEQSLSAPENWSPFPSDFQEDYLLVNLPKDSLEFKKILSLVECTIPHFGSLSPMISRVQNRRLWERYALTRWHMVDDLGQEQVNEKLLFHGTQATFACDICCQGFDWRLCGVNGTSFGKGCYFAEDASYSVMYCTRQSVQYLNSTLSATQGKAAVASLASLAHGFVNGIFSTAGHSTSSNSIASTTSATVNSTGSMTADNTASSVPHRATKTRAHNHSTYTSAPPSTTVTTAHNHSTSTSAFSVYSLGTTLTSGSVASSGLHPTLSRRTLFVARVLCGQMVEGYPSMKRPPINPSDPRQRPYNSACDNTGSPKIHIVFDSAQTYPEFLIHFD